MIDIQIAHPNDIIHDRWNRVESAADLVTMMEIIHAPSFETPKMTLVRAFEDRAVRYMGIYGDEGVIDLSRSGAAMKKHPWNFDRASGEYQSIPYAWAKFNDPSHGLWGVRNLVPKAMMTSTLLTLVEEYLPQDSMKIIRDYRGSDAIGHFQNHYNAKHGYVFQVISAKINKDGVAGAVRGMIHTRAITESKNDSERLDLIRKYNKHYADRVRELIPFHVIAEQLVKKYK